MPKTADPVPNVPGLYAALDAIAAYAAGSPVTLTMAGRTRLLGAITEALMHGVANPAAWDHRRAIETLVRGWQTTKADVARGPIGDEKPYAIAPARERYLKLGIDGKKVVMQISASPLGGGRRLWCEMNKRTALTVAAALLDLGGPSPEEDGHTFDCDAAQPVKAGAQ